MERTKQQDENERAVDEILQEHFNKDELDKHGVAQDEGIEEKTDEIAVQEEVESEDDEELSEDQLQERRNEVLALKEKGNASFRREEYKEAIDLYSEAIRKCRHKDLYPEKAILYSNRAASELKLSLSKPAIHSASQAIKYNPDYAKAYLRRAKAYDMDEKLDESLEDYKKVIELDRQSKEASEAIPGLERRITERNEKMKAEMIDKLKDLGNLVLRPFGLSTSNFQMAQDPNTGGYSINFKQN